VVRGRAERRRGGPREHPPPRRDPGRRPESLTSAADIVETAEEAAAQERPPLIVRRPLEEFLDGHGLCSGALEAERIGEGHSNLTYLVRRGEDRFVLRRPPRPPLPPSAHDVLREARVLAAIEATDARVPRVLATATEEESPLGVPFYVMPYIEGEVITTTVPLALDTAEERGRIARELIDALAEVHAVDPFAHGLESFGKPTGYLERQLRRFSGLWEHNKTREVTEVEQVADWLGRNLPESPLATIVHGDYRLGNAMYAPEAPARLVAIFDWELSTIGDPLADLGYLTATYAEPGDPETLLSGLSAVTRREGFPTRDELIGRYEERTGRSMSDLRWYQALALWKTAIFLEGNYKRFLQGASDDAWYRLMDAGIPEIARAALALTQQPAPSA
jgi:aminoglycoside phosphotransferase (APT) family kinase protein